MAREPSTQPAGQRERPRGPRQRGHVLVVRVPEDMLRRLEAYMTRARAAQPYLRLSRADVLRTLLDQALSAEGA